MYTKGPWGFSTTQGGDLSIWAKCKPPQRHICIVRAISVDFSEKEQEANARLIAAAPELLEALREAASILEDLQGDNERFFWKKANEFQSIIKKAEA